MYIDLSSCKLITNNKTKNLNQMQRNMLLNAVNSAHSSIVRSSKHGAVLFINNKKIIATKCNALANKLCGYHGPGSHSEARCLDHYAKHYLRHSSRHLRKQAKCRKYCSHTYHNQRLHKLSMFVVRLSNSGKLLGSKPCTACQYLLQMYGVKWIYYSNDNGNIVKCKLTDITNDEIHVSKSIRDYCWKDQISKEGVLLPLSVSDELTIIEKYSR